MSNLIGMENRIYTASNKLDEVRMAMLGTDVLMSDLMVAIKAMENQYDQAQGRTKDEIGLLKWIACEQYPILEQAFRTANESLRELNRAIMEYKGQYTDCTEGSVGCED